MGWPSYKTHHDLINQNRFFCQVLIIKETRGRRWPPLPPSICQSLTADTRGSTSRRHTVTVSYRRSCTPSPAPQGNVNKGRLVVSRLTSPPPLLSPLTLRHLWRASLTCLIDRPPKRSQPTRNNIGREGGQRPLCYRWRWERDGVKDGCYNLLLAAAACLWPDRSAIGYLKWGHLSSWPRFCGTGFN